MAENKSNWYDSSTGNGLALRAKSMMLGAVPVIVILADVFGFQGLTEASLTELVTQIVALISAAGFIYGWARAVYFKNKKLGKFAG